MPVSAWKKYLFSAFPADRSDKLPPMRIQMLPAVCRYLWNARIPAARPAFLYTAVRSPVQAVWNIFSPISVSAVSLQKIKIKSESERKKIPRLQAYTVLENPRSICFENFSNNHTVPDILQSPIRLTASSESPDPVRYPYRRGWSDLKSPFCPRNYASQSKQNTDSWKQFQWKINCPDYIYKIFLLS